MKLYDFLAAHDGEEFDVCDTEVDAEICVSFDDTELDGSLCVFCKELYKRIDVAEYKDDLITADLYGFIKANYDAFKEFATKYWYKNFDLDDDDLIAEWINEIGLYIAGYVSDGIYNLFVKEVLK